MKKILVFIFMLVVMAILGPAAAMAAQCGPGAVPTKDICEPGDTIMGNYTFPAATYVFGPGGTGTGTAFVIGASGITIDASAATFTGPVASEARMLETVSGAVGSESKYGNPNGLHAFYASARTGIAINGGTYRRLANILRARSSSTGSINGVYGEMLAQPLYPLAYATDLVTINNSTLVLCRSLSLRAPGSSGNTFWHTANEYDAGADSTMTDFATGIYAEVIPTGATVGAQVSLNVIFTLIPGTTVSSFSATISGGETPAITGSDPNRAISFTPTREGMYAVDCVLVDSAANTFHQKFQILVGATTEKTSATYYFRGGIIPDLPAVDAYHCERPYAATNPFYQHGVAVDDSTVFSETAPSETEYGDCASWVQSALNPVTNIIGRLKRMDYSITVSTSGTPPVNGHVKLVKAMTYFQFWQTTSNLAALTGVSATPTAFTGQMSLASDPIALESYADNTCLTVYMQANDLVIQSPSTITLAYDISDYPRVISISDNRLLVLSADHAVGSQNYTVRIANPTNTAITADILLEHDDGDMFSVALDGGTPTTISVSGGLLTVPVTIPANTSSATLAVTEVFGLFYLSPTGTGDGSIGSPGPLSMLSTIPAGMIAYVVPPGYSGVYRSMTPVAGVLYVTQHDITQRLDLSAYGDSGRPILLDDSWRTVVPHFGINFRSRWFDGVDN